MTGRPKRATVADYRQLCDLAQRRGLAVELVVSEQALGTDDVVRRLQTRLRLVPRAVRNGREVASTPIHPDDVFTAARRLLERVTISGSAR